MRFPTWSNYVHAWPSPRLKQQPPGHSSAGSAWLPGPRCAPRPSATGLSQIGQLNLGRSLTRPRSHSAPEPGSLLVSPHRPAASCHRQRDFTGVPAESCLPRGCFRWKGPQKPRSTRGERESEPWTQQVQTSPLWQLRRVLCERNTHAPWRHRPPGAPSPRAQAGGSFPPVLPGPTCLCNVI